MEKQAQTTLLRPKDAATLIILRADKHRPAVLMGRRHAAHAFMPNKYVFPGGRVDRADTRLAPVADMDAGTATKLLIDMKGRPSVNRARGLAMAAIRETYEEVGIIVGRNHSGTRRSASPGWADFLASGYVPDISPLRFFARAITPPMRTRRFDTRFFVVDYDAVVNLDDADKPQSDELLDSDWVELDRVGELDLPGITQDILRRLAQALDTNGRLGADYPISFQRYLNRRWRCDYL